jgi:hypothetical protein
MIPLIDYGGDKLVPFNTDIQINSIEELNNAEKIIRKTLITRDFNHNLLFIVDSNSNLEISFPAWHNFCWESIALGLSQECYYQFLAKILSSNEDLISYLETLPRFRDKLTLKSRISRKEVQDTKLFMEYRYPTTELISFCSDWDDSYFIVFLEDIWSSK